MQQHQEVAYNQFNPYPWYRYMREKHPVYYNEQLNLWYVFRYEHVQQVLSDPKNFSSEGSKGDTYFGSSFLSMDPPRHRRYRTLVSQAFTPRSIAQLEPRITAIVQQLIDAVISTRQMDVIMDLAYPLPATVIAELLGIPIADINYFKQLSERIVEEIESVSSTTHFAAQEELAAYLLPLIEQRRREPINDLISDLLEAEIDGEKLSTHDIQATCITLLIGGHETTTNLIGNAMFCFTEHPGVIEELRANPELMPGAIEEVLRYRSSVAGISRMTATDTHIGETAIQKGERLIIQLASAHRDETVFADPDRFDIRRTSNRKISFGHGIHFCLGAPLARLESKIALNALLARLPELQRDPAISVQLAVGTTGIFQGTKHLPITFTPQAR